MVEQIPVYFFNLRDGHKFEKDPEGGEFASLKKPARRSFW